MSELKEMRQDIKRLMAEINEICDEVEDYEEEDDGSGSETSREVNRVWYVETKNCSKYAMNRNFLVPNFRSCISAKLCVNGGRGVWPNRGCRRSTFAVVSLHPSLERVKSKVCRTTETPAYAVEKSFDISELCFDSVVPVIQVREWLGPSESVVYGTAFVSMQSASLMNGRITVLDNQWIPLITPASRTICGEVNVSLVFFEQESVAEILDEVSEEVRKMEDVEEKEEIREVKTVPIAHIASQTTRTRLLHMTTQTSVFLGDKDPSEMGGFLCDIDEYGRDKPPDPPREYTKRSRETKSDSDDDIYLDRSLYTKYDDFDWNY